MLGRRRRPSSAADGRRAGTGRSLTRIAHRGYPLDAPENTVAAVRRAAAGDRADAVEVDVRGCADDVVVIHDGAVDRVTDGTGPVAAFTAAELAGLSVDGSDEGVPRFAAVLAAVPADVALQVELKERAVVDDAIAAIRDADCPVVLSSFDPETVRACRERAPEIPRSLIFDRRPATALAAARRLGCVAIHPPVEFCVDDVGLRAALRRARTVDDVGRLGIEWTRRRGRAGLGALGLDALGPVVDEGIQRAVDRLDRGADVERAAETGGSAESGAASGEPTESEAADGIAGREERERVADAGQSPGPHLVGRELIARAHALGIAVNAWTVRRAETVDALRRTGVDGVSADAASVFGRP